MLLLSVPLLTKCVSLAVIATAKTSFTYLCRDGSYILVETLKNTMAVLVAQSHDG